MSQDEEGWRVATSPTEWVTVKTADDALRLGSKFAELVATIGVYKAERDRLSAEVEQLRKAGDAMYDFAVQDSLGYCVMGPFERWSKEHHSKVQGGRK